MLDGHLEVRVVGVAQKERLVLYGDKRLAALRHVEGGVGGVERLGEAIRVGCCERQEDSERAEGEEEGT